MVDCQVIQSRFHKTCGSWLVQVGAKNASDLKNVRKPQLFHYRRYMIHPKTELTEFKVSPDAVLPTGTNLTAAHFVPGQYVDCQATR